MIGVLVDNEEGIKSSLTIGSSELRSGINEGLLHKLTVDKLEGDALQFQNCYVRKTEKAYERSKVPITVHLSVEST